MFGRRIVDGSKNYLNLSNLFSEQFSDNFPDKSSVDFTMIVNPINAFEASNTLLEPSGGPHSYGKSYTQKTVNNRGGGHNE